MFETHSEYPIWTGIKKSNYRSCQLKENFEIKVKVLTEGAPLRKLRSHFEFNSLTWLVQLTIFSAFVVNVVLSRFHKILTQFFRQIRSGQNFSQSETIYRWQSYLCIFLKIAKTFFFKSREELITNKCIQKPPYKKRIFFS